MRNRENPFIFGTIVEEEYFTDRVQEVACIEQFIQSANHLVIISPRRFGKSSVVAKALKGSRRKSITVNLQQATSVSDYSAKLLKEFFKVHPLEKVRHLNSHFRVFPTVSLNPVTGSLDISFQPGAGYRDGSDVCYVGNYGIYWSSSASDESFAYRVYFYNYYVDPGFYGYRYFGYSVCLITESK